MDKCARTMSGLGKGRHHHARVRAPSHVGDLVPLRGGRCGEGGAPDVPEHTHVAVIQSVAKELHGLLEGEAVPERRLVLRVVPSITL
jgi:hypothetical protein